VLSEALSLYTAKHARHSSLSTNKSLWGRRQRTEGGENWGCRRKGGRVEGGGQGSRGGWMVGREHHEARTHACSAYMLFSTGRQAIQTKPDENKEKYLVIVRPSGRHDKQVNKRSFPPVQGLCITIVMDCSRPRARPPPPILPTTCDSRIRLAFLPQTQSQTRCRCCTPHPSQQHRQKHLGCLPPPRLALPCRRRRPSLAAIAHLPNRIRGTSAKRCGDK
jgi:hypothetical protein